MERLSYRAAICSLLVAAGLLIACNDDNNPTGTQTPQTATISGAVHFTGTWPSTGDVQVSIFSTLISPPGVPGGPPDAFTDPLNPATDFPDYHYTLEGIDPGKYAAIFVGWRDPANPTGAKLIGTYWVYGDSLGIAANGLPKDPGPAPVTLKAGDHRTNLNVTADLDLAP